MSVIGSLTGYVKRRFWKEPEHPNSLGFMVFTLLIGCLAVAVGVFGGAQGWLMPWLWVVLGLYFVARGIAETLPLPWHKMAVVLRIVADSIVLGTLVYVAAATIAFNA